MAAPRCHHLFSQCSAIKMAVLISLVRKSMAVIHWTHQQRELYQEWSETKTKQSGIIRYTRRSNKQKMSGLLYPAHFRLDERRSTEPSLRKKKQIALGRWRPFGPNNEGWKQVSRPISLALSHTHTRLKNSHALPCYHRRSRSTRTTNELESVSHDYLAYDAPRSRIRGRIATLETLLVAERHVLGRLLVLHLLHVRIGQAVHIVIWWIYNKTQHIYKMIANSTYLGNSFSRSAFLAKNHLSILKTADLEDTILYLQSFSVRVLTYVNAVLKLFRKRIVLTRKFL